MVEPIKRALIRMLDLICPAIPAGQQLPYGLSRGKDSGRGSPATEVVRLLLPVCLWRGENYQPHTDAYRHGWWLLTVMVAVLRTPGGFDVRLRAGSWARGYGRVRLTDHGAEWYDERAWSHDRRFVPKPLGR